MDIHICASANSKYMRYLYIMLYSVLESNADEHIVAYIFQRDFTERDKEILTNLFRAHSAEIRFLWVDEKRYRNFPEKDRYTLETFFRFEIIDRIPIDVDKVLYLDVDLIIKGTLRDLYCTSMDGYYFAACPDMIAHELLPYHRNLFHRYDDLRYFNAGVMLWNLYVLRAKIHFSDFMEAAKELNYDLPCVDQDVLNYLYYDKVLYLPPEKYNFMMTKFLRDGWNETDIRDAQILHFTGVNPWRVGPKAPAYKIWWDYAKKTPFYVELLEEQLNRTEKYLFQAESKGTVPKPDVSLINQILFRLFRLKGKGVIRKKLDCETAPLYFYGAGIMARSLWELLEADGVANKVMGIIDRRENVGEFWHTPMLQNASEIKNGQIIITPSYDIEKIYQTLRDDVNDNVRIVTLQEFLEGMYQEIKEEYEGKERNNN